MTSDNEKELLPELTTTSATSASPPSTSLSIHSHIHRQRLYIFYTYIFHRHPQVYTFDNLQVYRSEGPGHSYRWNKRTCGVVCFVKDNLKRSYYIRVFDMDRQALVFDQEIYNQFKYKSPRPYFHTFEGDDAQIGLNFADEGEADIFRQTVGCHTPCFD